MSSITLADIQAIRPGYSNLSSSSRPENPTGQCPYRQYSFEEAAKSPIYKCAIKTDAEVISTYKKISAKEFTSMDEVTFFDFLQVALSLKDPVEAKPIFTDPYLEANLCSDFKTAKPSPQGKVSFAPSAGTAATVVLVPTSSATPAMPIPEEGSTQAQAICFLFSWMTRFAIKSPSNELGIQYDSVRKTYMKHYQASSAVFDNFRPDANWIKGIRKSFDSFVRVRNTLILNVAAAETKYKQSPKTFNVLRYLYCQHLEFMGLHAYVSIVNIMSKLALPPAKVLTWLRINGDEMAIDEAYDIMTKFDNGMIDNGLRAERLWKYARCLDQGYFTKLQTTYVSELMATLAWIEVKSGISSESGYSSPLNIYAIANNSHIKEVGRMKADAFMRWKNSVVSLSQDASVVDRMYAAQQGVSVQQFETVARPSDMEIDETTIRGVKRRVPDPETSTPSISKKPPPTAILSGIPNF